MKKRKEELFKEALSYVIEAIKPITNNKVVVTIKELYIIADKVGDYIQDFEKSDFFDGDENLAKQMKECRENLAGDQIRILEALVYFSNYIEAVVESLEKKTIQGRLFITSVPVVLSEGDENNVASFLKSIIGIGLPAKAIKYENANGVGFYEDVGDNLDFFKKLLRRYREDNKNGNLPAKVYLVMEGEPYLEE